MGVLEVEMDDNLSYPKYDYKNKETDNNQNGYIPKTVTSFMENITLDIPKDGKGIFESQSVKKSNCCSS